MKKSVVVLGPTASGKSDVAMAAATTVPNVHIIAADAMQVYRRMDIGTAKPTEDDQSRVVHYCVDVAEPSERYSVARFAEDVAAARKKISKADASELIVGGTGLYVTALVDGLSMPGDYPKIRAQLEANRDTEALYEQLSELDPEAVKKIDPNNRRRMIRALEVCLGSGKTFSSFGEGIGAYPPVDTVQIGIKWQREALRERIALRVHKMIEAGLVDEVRGVLNESKGISDTARQALGYKEIIEHLERRWSLEEAIDATILRTQQFAVRQERWYRRDPRIQWVEVQNDPIEEVAPLVVAALA
ncbi:MAG: tRNA (adenosine(37)-N6)-dimethylallyltransferase MiaA [Actinobacteria bacterium]|nr:tRNA (adenosine(37)-N6)-dimethylallyltransferase MiaA [Actinomycetota bacterium]